MAPEVILHHYDFSNFSEKVRLILGLKGRTWRSVEIPSIAPKPDYSALTGGYRRTPALQIGAEIFCDTALIAEELEARFPEPSLYPGPEPAAQRAWCAGLAIWAETTLCWSAALYITGLYADRFPISFHRDRAAFHGKGPPTVERVRAAASRNLAQLRPQLQWLDGLFGGGRRFALGEAVSLADLVIYHPLWLMDRVAGQPVSLITEGVREWMGRVAAIGHGDPQPMAASEAIATARRSELPAARPSQSLDGDPRPGTRVAVVPSDYGGAEPTTGILISIDAQRVAVRRSDPRAGEVAVHFPRMGYRLREASAG